jgi:two-component system sensor histidine kinase AtoS
MHGAIREVLGFTEPITRQRGVEVECRMAAASAEVVGDRELLKQAILNLILNALQAMPSHGRLSVSTLQREARSGSRAGHRLEIRIRDTGVGIAPENLRRIFDPFFTTNSRGTGLGLRVVHRIIERHSGRIRVESVQGVGTTFTVVLPCAAPADRTADQGV